MKRTWPLLLLGLLCASCDSAPVVLCDQIPEGGCPLDRGGTCDDAACEALYGCYDGVWKRVETCEPGTGGAGGGTTTGAGGGTTTGAGGGTTTGTGGGGCTPIELDHSMDATSCMPSLQAPDCPAAVAESCPEKACTTGCLDFFLCRTDGWAAVAYCDEDGNFFEAPR